MMQVSNQAEIALKQAEYVEQLKEKTKLALFAAERANTFTHILYQIRHAYDIDIIFQIITEEMCHVLKSDRCVIYQFNADWSGQVVAESFGSESISLLAQQEEDEVLRGNRIYSDRCIVNNWLEGEQQNIFLSLIHI